MEETLKGLQHCRKVLGSLVSNNIKDSEERWYLFMCDAAGYLETSIINLQRQMQSNNKKNATVVAIPLKSI